MQNIVYRKFHINMQKFLTTFHKCLKRLAKKVNDQYELEIVFGTASR